MNKLKNHIQTHWNHLSGKKIFIACSGGLDSITLLHLFSTLKFDVEVLHVNYHLRGEDSDKDEAFVRSTCLKLEVPFHLKSIYLQKTLDKGGGNLQDIARKVRYTFFESFKSPTNYIALAHHKGDQVESFFLNLARKSGIMGMACMLPQHAGIIRPFLSFSKEEIKNYALENNITWREDLSNASNKYKRNLLRNQIIPELKQNLPNLSQSVLDLVNAFQQTQKNLEEELILVVGLIHCLDRLQIKVYELMTPEQRHELVRQMRQKPSLVAELDKLCSSQGGKYIDLQKPNAKDYSFVLRQGAYFFFLTNRSDTLPIPEIQVEKIHELPDKFNKNSIYLDPSKVRGELKLRHWTAGDRISSVGMKGTQLISDIIKDAKLPPIEKSNILLLVDDHHILWCVGLKVSSVALSDKNSRQFIKVSLNYD
jgi:tRNA(Ile)-lysidine synthase